MKVCERIGPWTVVRTAYVCVACGYGAVHVEAWEGDDQAQGLDDEHAVCGCGGPLVEDRRGDRENGTHRA